MSRKEKKAKKVKKTIVDSYDESSRDLTDHQAHRDVVYALPSKMSQTMQCYFVQMKRYTRQRVMVLSSVLLILMPVIYYAIKGTYILEWLLPTSAVTNIAIAGILSFMPILIVLLSCIACGSILSQEFNERTAFLSLPLPMSRSSFYMGKFLAAFTLVGGIVAAAYGIAMLLTMTGTDRTYTWDLFRSLMVSLCFVFFCCSTTYMLSTKLKRGSTMLPFILLFIVLPLIAEIVPVFFKMDVISKILGCLPCFGADVALNMLGYTNVVISFNGIFSNFVPGLIDFSVGGNPIIMSIVCILSGALFLFLGYYVVKRRDV